MPDNTPLRVPLFADLLRPLVQPEGEQDSPEDKPEPHTKAGLGKLHTGKPKLGVKPHQKDSP